MPRNYFLVLFMSDTEMDSIEKPRNKSIKKRVASEKQIEHLKKIQPKATEAKKKNKEIIQTVKKYEAVKKPMVDYDSMRKDVSLIKEYLTREESRKLQKRAQKESVDKQSHQEYSIDVNNLFR